MAYKNSAILMVAGLAAIFQSLDNFALADYTHQANHETTVSFDEVSLGDEVGQDTPESYFIYVPEKSLVSFLSITASGAICPEPTGGFFFSFNPSAEAWAETTVEGISNGVSYSNKKKARAGKIGKHVHGSTPPAGWSIGGYKILRYDSKPSFPATGGSLLSWLASVVHSQIVTVNADLPGGYYKITQSARFDHDLVGASAAVSHVRFDRALGENFLVGNRYVFDDGEHTKNNWMETWYGWVFASPETYGWYYHDAYGWQYIDADQDKHKDVWIYDSSTKDWVWTKKGTFPTVWSHNHKNWYDVNVNATPFV